MRNASDSVTVHFGLGLIQMELNEKDNQLTMSMWTKYVSVYSCLSREEKFLMVVNYSYGYSFATPSEAV